SSRWTGIRGAWSSARSRRCAASSGSPTTAPWCAARATAGAARSDRAYHALRSTISKKRGSSRAAGSLADRLERQADVGRQAIALRVVELRLAPDRDPALARRSRRKLVAQAAGAAVGRASVRARAEALEAVGPTRRIGGDSLLELLQIRRGACRGRGGEQPGRNGEHGENGGLLHRVAPHWASTTNGWQRWTPVRFPVGPKLGIPQLTLTARVPDCGVT